MFVIRVRPSTRYEHDFRVRKPDAELQMKPMVLEGVLRIQNFYYSMSPIHFELRPDGKWPQERERPTHSHADTGNVFGRRGFQVHVPSLPEIDELGQLQIISPGGIFGSRAGASPEKLELPCLSTSCSPGILARCSAPDRNLFER